ncbi:MAG: glycosyltransferase family A protein [Candidatus Pacebacteria bacterium]|nr:glycosyltransferase family A protein [Candidatus Paceibacterota bacterium]
MVESSVVIRTKNQGKWLGECLKRLSEQTYKNFEIVIVDSGSTDNTLEIAKKYGAKIFEIKQEQFSFPFALNYGCERASAEKYFIFMSGHCWPISKTWIEDGMKDFSLAENIMGVYGPVWALPDGSFWEKIIFNKYISIIKMLFRKKRIVRKDEMGAVGFTNAIIKRKLWDEYHFNEAFGFGGEDSDWVRHWFNNGMIAVKDIKFSIYHSHGLGLKKLLEQHKYWGSVQTPQPFRELTHRKK